MRTFIGGINKGVRDYLYFLSSKGFLNRFSSCLIPCSGNFNIERELRAGAYTGTLISNDISLYSMGLGKALIGECLDIEIMPPFEWMLEGADLEDGSRVAALIANAQAYSGYIREPEKDNEYFIRNRKEYENEWSCHVSNMVDKISRLRDFVKINQFSNICMTKIITDERFASRDVIIIGSPPTYKGGYEKIFYRLNQIFTWSKPDYSLINNDVIISIFGELAKRGTPFILISDMPDINFAKRICKVVKPKFHDFYLYSNINLPKLVIRI